ncbi:rRNA maturation RNase YbeY [Candidatus Shikimatogenerans silvanidophilus]|uniref:rRNA maturation RNase YbeY n=1 Tax=Candidatus Shikimatogenerans silvanidophilus TaxID=2782547 RepID=UPI001BAB9945|nr:rRNA maturation RNase YbeY [Candidatus Shikimatogenerans silvanidophilus]
MNKNKINFFYEIHFFIKKKRKFYIEKWINNVFFLENYLLGEINYIFCNDIFLKKILKFNKKFYYKNYTDVIAFNYNNNKKINGDIFINIDQVKENSKNYNQKFLIEFLRILVHPILHFFNYKDNNLEQKINMLYKENFYISLFLKQSKYY